MSNAAARAGETAIGSLIPSTLRVNLLGSQPFATLRTIAVDEVTRRHALLTVRLYCEQLESCTCTPLHDQSVRFHRQFSFLHGTLQRFRIPDVKVLATKIRVCA